MNNNQLIGLRKGEVKLLKHNEKWHVIARDTITQLKSILQNKVVDIQHVGSTSIHNIYAKPIIDLVIGQKNLNDILDKNIITKLEKNGYIHDKEHDNDAKIFFYKGEGEVITHHIHAVIYGEGAWNSLISVRDYLNNNYDIARKYEIIKLEAEKICDNDIDKYYNYKAELLKEIKKEALKQSSNN